MVPAYSYEIVKEELKKAFQKRFQDSLKGESYMHAEFGRLVDDNRVKMVGLLFARPNSRLAKSDILPHLDYFHHRSSKHIDFFCAGFGQYWGSRPEFADHQRVVHGRDAEWLFSSKKFDSFRQEIEGMTNWKYSGASDLLLSNARFDPSTNNIDIDFSSTICCQLDQMVEEKAIRGVDRFFEDIFRFAENATGGDPTWGFSDRKGLAVTGSAIRRVILSLIPKKLGADVQKLEHFAVRNVAKSASV